MANFSAVGIASPCLSRLGQDPRGGRVLVGPLIVAVLGERFDLGRIGLGHDGVEEHVHRRADQPRIGPFRVPIVDLGGVVERDQLEIGAVLAQSVRRRAIVSCTA